MLGELVKLKANGQEIEISCDQTFYDVCRILNVNQKRKYIIARVNGKYIDLAQKVIPNCEVTFYDLTDHLANKMYQNGLINLIKFTFQEIHNDYTFCKVKHSADKGICFITKKKITKEEIKLVEDRMRKLVEANIIIERKVIPKVEAIEYFKRVGDIDKANILMHIPSSFVNLFKLSNMYNMMCFGLPYYTGCLEEFSLHYLDDDEFILEFPTIYMNDSIKTYEHHEKLFESFRESKERARILGVETVGDLNEKICQGKANDLIRMSETLQNGLLLKKASELADNSKKIKVVLMSGPSSSGKTTTCSKLALYLSSLGITPKTISMDDFFKDRVDTPKKPNGEYDFECLEAVDLKLFNKTIESLLKGDTVKMPTFDFYSGEKKFKKEMKLEKTDMLLIEGIHALNPKILSDVPKEKKYKIYLCPLTAVNLDTDNKSSTTDNRLLRRILRDSRTRGYSVTDTLSIWPNVRDGEEKYVFAFQDEADYVFNTSLIYEFSVLKTYVLPLLHSVKENDKNFEEAQRLIYALDIFMPIPSEAIPDDSILREFIGNSCF